MKKLVLILGTFLLFLGVNAQKVKMQNNKINDANSIQMTEYLKMKNGKMLMIKDGKMSQMNKEKKLSNGTMVSTNGMLKMKNGQTMMLKNGDMINMHGMMMKNYIKMKDGRMIMMKDGRMIMMEKDMKMSNGAMVSPNGKVKMKNGHAMMMKNGQMMDMNGMIMKEKTEMK